MSKECHTCGYEGNPENAEFCETCGAELGNATNTLSISSPNIPSPPGPSSIPSPSIPSPPLPPPTQTAPMAPPTPTVASPITPIVPPVTSPPVATTYPSLSATTARLVSKLSNAPVSEFPIHGYASVGIFTPESGPVDIDLEQFPGNDTISKQHAEILYDNGIWKLKDQSTNGTYIKPVGQTRFGARIMAPTPLNSGDEIAFAKIVFIFQFP